MSIFKCKMCGGALEIGGGETVVTCEYCGTQQTLPRLDDDRRVNLYDRANHFRRSNEFDKAMGIYEQILTEDASDAEAYWSLVLCRYGIEYVEDPATHKRIPTVNRAQFTSIFDDDNYKSALQYADTSQRVIYEQEAKAINEIQKGILAISQQEEPFDVFICYKETDANGRRTPDSVLANDLYHQLTQEGFKVFFARITLEDKLGSAYEPYIFAALNSAKVMVVLGTRPEYFNAVWVKNEWSRYLSLIRQGQKKMLIPAYKDMDPYDLPEEFSHLQAQDMSKLGFMQDLIRGIKKIAQADEPKQTVVKETVVTGGAANAAPLLRRAMLFLEDGDWASADEYCEKVLDLDPENAQAYLGKLMAELQVRRQEDLRNCAEPFDGLNNYQKTLRFADDKLRNALQGYISYIKERNETARLNRLYSEALTLMQSAKEEAAFKEAARKFFDLDNFKDSQAQATKCLELAEAERKNEIYRQALTKMSGKSVECYEAAIEQFASIPDWRDADSQIKACKKAIAEIEEQERLAEEKRQEQLRLAQEKATANAKRAKKIALISAPIVAVVIAFLIVLTKVIIPNGRYNDAVELMEAGQYKEAATMFLHFGDYRDARELSTTLWDQITGRKQVIAAGTYHTVGLKSDGTVVAVGNNDDGQCDVSSWTDIVAIAAGGYHTVGLRSDGTVVAVGDNNYGQHNVSDWTDIVAIAASGHHTVGLKSDGTVVAVGDNDDGECDVSDWTDIVAIAAGYSHTVGLKSDGTVVAVGRNDGGQCDVSKWKDIVTISAYSGHTAGLKSDGTVMAVGRNDYGQCDVSDWTDMVAVSISGFCTVGLKSDGTVVAVGINGFIYASGWTDIIAVATGFLHTVGLKSDGTVVAVGGNHYGECDVSDWTDIVAIAARGTVGLKSDGTVVATGSYSAPNWTDIKLPE